MDVAYRVFPVVYKRTSHSHGELLLWSLVVWSCSHMSVMQPQVGHVKALTPVAALSMLYITPCQIYAFHVTLYKFHLI